MKVLCSEDSNSTISVNMLNKAIKEWLADYKGLPDAEIHSFASTLRENKELVIALYQLFESPPNEFLDPVCHQLYEFYRSVEPELRRFAVEFVPSLIWLYLRTLSANDKKSCGGVEAFLLGIYNLDIVDSVGNLKFHTFRIPNLGKKSLYHQVNIDSTTSLTASVLSRYNSEVTWKSGPLSQYESINGQNRHAILAHLIQCYYCDIASLSTRSHQAFCKACSRICSAGFSNLDSYGSPGYNSPDYHNTDKCNGIIHEERPVPRLAVSPALLVEMLSCLYFIMYNGEPNLGVQAVEDIHARGSYELYADVLIVTSAIRNSLKMNPTGQPIDGLMGIKQSSTNTSTSTSLAKSAITNASFRTKKLPDDIPVVEDTETSSNKLASIDEDTGSDGQSNTPSNQSSKHNFKIPGLPNFGKGGKKDKLRGKDMRKDSDASMKSSSATQNGDSLSSDMVNVAVSRNPSKIVDSIELQPMVKKSASLHDESNMTVSNSSDDSASNHSDSVGFLGHSSSTSTIREKKNNLTNSLTNPDSLSTDM